MSAFVLPVPPARPEAPFYEVPCLNSVGARAEDRERGRPGGPRERWSPDGRRRATHTHLRARALTNSPLAHALPGAALAPRLRACAPRASGLGPRPLPHRRAGWGVRRRAKVLSSRRGPDSRRSGPRGLRRIFRATGRRGQGGSAAGPLGARVSGMERWGARGAGAAPALQLEFQMSSSFQIGAALY